MDRLQKSFEFAADAAKLMIVLSTTIIAFSIVLLAQIVDDTAVATATLQVAWVAFAIAVLAGLWCLTALTATLSRNGVNGLSVRNGSAEIAMGIQLAAFALGIAFTVSFGMTSARARRIAVAESKKAAAALAVANARPPAPPPTVTSIERVLSIGPFASADTILADSGWTVAERDVRAALNASKARGTVDGILLAGGVDQRPLALGALRRFGSNEGLANARTQVVAARLRRLVDSSVTVSAVGVRAQLLGDDSTAAGLRQNRRVDVYFILRR